MGSSNKSQVLNLLRNFAKPCLDVKHDQISSRGIAKRWLLFFLEVGVTQFAMQAPRVCTTGAPKTTACISLVSIAEQFVCSLSKRQEQKQMMQHRYASSQTWTVHSAIW